MNYTESQKRAVWLFGWLVMRPLRYNDFVHEIKKEKKTAKPSVYFSESLDLWIVEYFDNKTKLMSLGNYEDQH